ncbi:hypothetical protein PL263_10545 [Methylomonas sp. EFPC3]|uniref:hypothetical protein n=1 Tax=Methylomonas sp. EFPC3 TaxID=3021710 RepID=UPI0024170C01|nr:hypothetical protein [Methylomonas sp. EFPC3]WFP48552.1 hypothetical protein PL263_10545 [Methylomonas sp. EFPC3]
MRFVPLARVADVQLGKMLSPKAKTGSSYFRYLRNTNVQWGRLDLSDLAQMDFSEAERKKFELRFGDLLVCEGGEPGRCAVWRNEVSDCYYQKALHRVRPHEDKADSEFISLWIRHQASTGVFEDQNAKTTIAHLPQVRLEQLLIPDVSITQQRQIATRLKAQLAEVDTARQAVQVQLRDAGLLRQRLLKQTFDALADGPHKVLGKWVMSYRNGFGKRPGEGETGPIVLRIADVSSGIIDLCNPRCGAVSLKEAHTYRLQTNDLLFIRVNGARHIVGRCCVVGSNLPADTIFNDHLIRVCLKPGIDPEYVRFCVEAPSARTRIEEAASTSAGQLTINQDVIGGIEVPDISINDQRRIVTALKQQLAEADALRAALEQQLRDLDALPQRILAQAFQSGAPIA